MWLKPQDIKPVEPSVKTDGNRYVESYTSAPSFISQPCSEYLVKVQFYTRSAFIIATKLTYSFNIHYRWLQPTGTNSTPTLLGFSPIFIAQIYFCVNIPKNEVKLPTILYYDF
jgi:hypothetical protein